MFVIRHVLKWRHGLGMHTCELSLVSRDVVMLVSWGYTQMVERCFN